MHREGGRRLEVELSQFCCHCCGQIPLYFIKYAPCSVQFCWLPDLLKGICGCKVNGGTCQALTCPQVWALCTEPCGANITPILGILFTHQSTAIICVIMPNHVYTMFHHTVIYQTPTITLHKVSQVLPSLYFTLTILTDS